MNIRLFLLMNVFATAALTSWASGSGDGPSGMPPPGLRRTEIPSDAREYEGEYKLVDGILPALIDEGQSTWYLIFNYPLTEDLMPKEGTAILVNAVPLSGYSDRIRIFSLEVDGVIIEPELSKKFGPPDGASGGPPGEGAGGPG